MSQSAALVEESFAKIQPQLSSFGTRFYENLFAANPAAKPLFANTDLAAQEEKLVNSLEFVVENLRNPTVVQEALHTLGARHVGYGTVPEHYPLVGNALLATLAEYLGDAWTPAVEQAWSDAYRALTQLMLEGAHRELA